MPPTDTWVIMTDSNSTISFYLPQSVQDSLDVAARASGVSRSTYIKQLLEREFGTDAALPARIDRQLTFLEIAVDGMLKAHPDATLRGIVHDTFNRRRTRRGELVEEPGR